MQIKGGLKSLFYEITDFCTEILSSAVSMLKKLLL